jgi:hypothetical protein
MRPGSVTVAAAAVAVYASATDDGLFADDCQWLVGAQQFDTGTSLLVALMVAAISRKWAFGIFVIFVVPVRCRGVAPGRQDLPSTSAALAAIVLPAAPPGASGVPGWRAASPYL